MRQNAIIDTLEPRQHFAATLIPGETYATRLATTGAQKNWTIPLVAGQNVTLAAGDRSGSALQTELILIGPTGKVYRRSVGEEGSFISLNVPVSGNWRVRLRDLDRDHVGSVQVTAFYYAPNITDGDDAFVAESGRRRAATADLGDLDVWTIPASRGQFISILASENTVGSPIDIGVLVIGPDGRVVTGGESETGVKIDIPNAMAGNYYAIVYEAGANDHNARYGISLAQTPGPQYTGDPDTIDPLVSGVPRVGDLPGGDLDIWGVTAGVNRTINLSIARGTGSLDPELLLVSPTGQIVASANGTTFASLSYNTGSLSGTYWIIARDREGDDGGQYSLTYTLT